MSGNHHHQQQQQQQPCLYHFLMSWMFSWYFTDSILKKELYVISLLLSSVCTCVRACVCVLLNIVEDMNVSQKSGIILCSLNFLLEACCFFKRQCGTIAVIVNWVDSWQDGCHHVAKLSAHQRATLTSMLEMTGVVWFGGWTLPTWRFVLGRSRNVICWMCALHFKKI